MKEATEKELLLALVKDVGEMKSVQANMKTKQDSMDLILHDIRIDLNGTCSDPERGIINRVKQNEKCVHILKKKQYKIFVWGIVIFTFIGLLFEAVRTYISMKPG